MNIGLFGGTFDPIHRGHIALAQAAMEQYKLHRVHFVPANIPPHKQKQPLTPFFHRFAMLALATAQEKSFIPSLLEAPDEPEPHKANPAKPSLVKKGNAKPEAEPPNYTIDTIRRLKQSFKGSDHLFLLIGMDAFADIAKWHEAESLFGECEFIVASRPGYSLADVANALPESLRPRPEVTKPFQKQAAVGDLVLKGATIHVMGNLNQPASATAIREAIAAGKSLGKFLDPAVAEYIKKMGLYK
ncbi:MAG TPA: nicotinate-nucleotide adenylyltransferase [Candidatus Solibacter sp.]|nr:nicotinate-nucleotide adenylyltransferase [Candidatus Solibacter sp.]